MKKGDRKPIVFVIGGPNGAGKSTSAEKVLGEVYKVAEFVNADVIARGLAAFDPASVAMKAGRIMLQRLGELADARADFAFETTMSSRTFAPFLRRLKSGGYEVHLLFVWLESADLAVQRVRARVISGGHHVPEHDICRRYTRAIHNLVELYIPVATAWTIYR